MRSLRRHLTYANVMSTIAVVLALGGATALAATHLKKNSVNSKAIKNGAVKTADLKNAAVTTGKLDNNAVDTGKVAANAITTGKIDAKAVTGGKIAADTVTGADIDEGSLHFACNVGTATPLLGGPCVARLSSAGASWQAANDACRVIDPGATLPTPAQIAAYAPLGGVPWKSGIFWTSDFSGNGPSPSGAWAVQTDANGTDTVNIATPLTATTIIDIACVYDPATASRPGA
jgi:hypothetical protein